MARVKSMKRKNKITNTFIYIALSILSVVWVIPIFLILYLSFSPLTSEAVLIKFPALNELTFIHYLNLFDTGRSDYLLWFKIH